MKCLSILTDPNQKESKSDQAGGTEQGPLSFFHGGTLGPERETGKNKATATGLGLIDKGSGTAAKQIPLIRTSCKEGAEFILLYRGSLILCTIPQEQRMVPEPKQKIRGPGLS